MSLDWSTVKSLAIPEGDVAAVSIGGVEVWRKLPYDAEVEYIESTGTQWIDTGILPTLATDCAWRMAVTYTGTSNMAMFGRYGSNNDRFQFFRIGNSGFASIGIGSAINTTIIIPAAATDYTMSTTTATATIGEQTVSGFSLSSIVQSSILIGSRGITSDTQLVGRIYSCSISQSGVLVRDFVPVRVGSGANAVGCLYDRANPTGGPLGNGLYTNAGTGAFVVGPDKTA